MPKENQRVAISKRLLKEGVMKLLKEKPIGEISVSELCALSEINRTTFYRHYQTPRDVLLEIEFDYVERLRSILVSSKDAGDLRKQATRMCGFLYENKDEIKLFMENSTDGDVTLIFQNFVNGIVDSRKLVYRGRGMGPDTLRLMQTFYSYGAYALVRQWISEDIPLTAEEVAELFVGLVNQDFSFQ